MTGQQSQIRNTSSLTQRHGATEPEFMLVAAAVRKLLAAKTQVIPKILTRQPEPNEDWTKKRYIGKMPMDHGKNLPRRSRSKIYIKADLAAEEKYSRKDAKTQRKKNYKGIAFGFLAFKHFLSLLELRVLRGFVVIIDHQVRQFENLYNVQTN